MAKISAVVLAAGAARRFGRTKQLERWPQDGPTLVERAVMLALQTSVSEVIVVTGNRGNEVLETLGELKLPADSRRKPIYFVYNERWQDGQGFSVATGVHAIDEEASAALFILADQPRLKVATVQAILDHFEQWSEDDHTIIFPTYNGKRGNPALFGRAFFGELAALQGDSGGREVVRAHPDSVLELPVDDPAIHEDVDTPEDLARLTE